MALVVNHPLANEGDVWDESSIPELGRSPGGGHGNPVQYSCLENPMDRGAWQATVHGSAKSGTQLKQLSMHTCPEITGLHPLKKAYRQWIIGGGVQKPRSLAWRWENLWYAVYTLELPKNQAEAGTHLNFLTLGWLLSFLYPTSQSSVFSWE